MFARICNLTHNNLQNVALPPFDGDEGLRVTFLVPRNGKSRRAMERVSLFVDLRLLHVNF